MYRNIALCTLALGLGACSTPQAPPAAAAAGTRPLLVAHRAGAADAPENTLVAIRTALRNGADAMWLSVQLSRDGVPVLYRPADLAANTDGSGPVADKTVEQLQQLNAGWQFRATDSQGAITYPYRDRPVPIPTLREALASLPPGMPVMLDMKALPAGPQADAVARVLDHAHAWDRATLYSTEAAYQQAFAAYPRARLFETRDATRGRLAQVALQQQCVDAPARPVWAAFEYRRALDVVEKFTLGEGRSPVRATLWTPASVACFRSVAPVRILAIGVNTADDYRAAAALGVDAVMVDSPRAMRGVPGAGN